MTEMDKARFWAFGWAQAFLFHDLNGAKHWRRLIWAQHRHEMECRAEDAQWGEPRCSFCEQAGHDETQWSCPNRFESAAVYAFCGSRMYPRPEGGAK